MADPVHNASEYLRSGALMSAETAALLVVDVQEKLIGLIPGHARLVWNIGRLIDAAALLGVTTVATEQYPQGLGPTVPELASRLESLGPLPAKVAFSCAACPEVIDRLRAEGRHQVLVAGIESHVCVQQTALDLLAAGFAVYLPVDAIAARHPIDHDTALGRMESSGATLTTTEATLFEWCQQAGTREFKEISRLVKEEPGKDEGGRRET